MAERILIVRLSAIGDTILTVPVACALRRSFPDATIGWIVQKNAAGLLQGHEAIDELIQIPRLSYKDISGFRDACKLARAFRPSIAIDVQGLAKSALLAYVSGAKIRIGFSKSEYEGREGSAWLNNHLVAPGNPHVVIRNLDLLTHLGVESPIVEYCFPEFEDDTRFAQGVHESMFHSSPFAIINVGAGWESKLWPAERFAAVAEHLQQHHGLNSLVLWGGKKEEAIADSVVNLSRGTALKAPNTTLFQLRSLIRKARLFIGSDTGPMHLSVALGTPTVGLIGPMPAERVGPLNTNEMLHRTVQNEKLSPAKRKDRKHDMGPMLSIQVEAVCQACDSILETAPARVEHQ